MGDNKQLLVSVSREYGSGGHDIAQKLAENLGIKFYDRNILEELSGDSFEAGRLGEFDEKPTSFFSVKFGSFDTSAENTVARMQFKFLLDKAAAGESFVVVGRCADTVLQTYKCLFKFFIEGNTDDKILRVRRKYGLSEQDALAKMIRNDKKRRQYHNEHSSFKWGDSRGYHMCVNSSPLGVDKTAELLEEYIRKAGY